MQPASKSINRDVCVGTVVPLYFSPACLHLPSFFCRFTKPWQRLHFCALLALIKFWLILFVILSWRNWYFLYCLWAKLEKARSLDCFFNQKTPKADGQVKETQLSASHYRTAKNSSMNLPFYSSWLGILENTHKTKDRSLYLCSCSLIGCSAASWALLRGRCVSVKYFSSPLQAFGLLVLRKLPKFPTWRKKKMHVFPCEQASVKRV